MHGNPLTPWDGRSFWNHNDFSTFGLLGEAYVSFRTPVLYLTDTGRNWNGDHNVKDSFSANNSEARIRNTQHLIQLLEATEFQRLYLNFHPERWGLGIWRWAKALVRDYSFNVIKSAAQLVLGLRNRE
jgi:hypothetical protein